MIFKKIDSKQKQIDTLQNLLSLSTSEAQKALIAKDLQLLKKGYESELQNAYYLDFYLEKSENLIILHDVRIEHNGQSAQIDHMLISRFGIELLESKSFSGVLTINNDTSLTIDYNGKLKNLQSPLEQSKRHALLLKEYLDEHTKLSARFKFLGGINISSVVLIHPETVTSNKTLPEHFFRADTFITARQKDIDNTSFFNAVKLISKFMTIESAKELAELIKKAHKPVEFDYTKKYKVHNTTVPNQSNEVSKILHEGDACPFCQNKLIQRQGKNGLPFLGCSSYPKCRFMRIIKK